MARPLYSLAVPQPYPIVFNAACGMALSAFTSYANLGNIVIPANYKVIGVSLMVGRRGGTHVTSTLDITVGGVSILAAVFNIATLTPGTRVDKDGAALAAGAAAILNNTALNIVTVESGGTTPTWGDVTVQIDVVPIGS